MSSEVRPVVLDYVHTNDFLKYFFLNDLLPNDTP